MEYIALEIMLYNEEKEEPDIDYITIATSEKAREDDIANHILQLLVDNKLVKESGYYSFMIADLKADKKEYEKIRETRNKNNLIDGYFAKKGDKWVVENYPCK